MPGPGTVCSRADEPVLRNVCARLQYRVKVHVGGTGELTSPEKDKGAARNFIVAKAAIEYDEPRAGRSAGDENHAFTGTSSFTAPGKMEHDNTIRPAVRRVVVMRVKNTEVPFSPDGS